MEVLKTASAPSETTSDISSFAAGSGVNAINFVAFSLLFVSEILMFVNLMDPANQLL